MIVPAGFFLKMKRLPLGYLVSLKSLLDKEALGSRERTQHHPRNRLDCFVHIQSLLI